MFTTERTQYINMDFNLKKRKRNIKNDLVALQLRLRAPKAGGLGLTPGKGTRPHMPPNTLQLRPGSAKYRRITTGEVYCESWRAGLQRNTPKKENRNLSQGVGGMRGTKTNKVNDAINLVGNYIEREQKL